VYLGPVGGCTYDERSRGMAQGKTVDFKSYSAQDILGVVAQAEGELQSRKKSTIKKLKIRFNELAEKEGLTVAEVVGISRKRRSAGQRAPVEAKFRNPDNTAETWSGRGRTPLWLAPAMKKHGKAKLLVPKSPAALAKAGQGATAAARH